MGDMKKIDVSEVTQQELKDAIRAVRPGEPLTVLRDGVERMQVVIPGPAEYDDDDPGYRLGCIVGAAIVAWGDAMRGMVRRYDGVRDPVWIMSEADYLRLSPSRHPRYCNCDACRAK